MPSLKREAAKFKELSALAAAQPEEIRTRRAAAEDTYNRVLGRLGAPGTYDQTTTGTAPNGILGTGTGAAAPPGSPEAASIFKTEKVKGAQATDIDRRFASDANLQDVTKLDPEATLKSLEGTSQFRTMSKLQAESEQLVNREGPLWDEMIKNQQLPIIESSAAIARQNAEDVKRAMAKGGAARRAAFETVTKIREQERINSNKIQQIANARVALDQWSRTNAQNVIQFGQQWASNLGGIREQYNTAMDKASELMLTGALPQMADYSSKAAALRKQAHEEQRNKTMRWVKGVAGVVLIAASAYTGGATAGLGASLLGSAVSGGGESGGGGGGGIGSGVADIVGGLLNKNGADQAPTNPGNDWILNTGNAGVSTR